ncbi:NAD-glutamate dehydrogenase [Anaplasma phagocytophilum]|uniref:Glutamate/Leucine/Phenylalanine/Valine dehydrogenase family protein n=1 Tax=Anaplasma phagocytophilum str. ApWI1 TaxID=1359155 RepID=A0A0F3PXN7_ANAPH|nr:NAD-glutamate dehydrogenase [Anaplasma phagocytophilum]KJZ98347.1 glutamate/Leucine/Phenylalanine/Valine dehydrogenase family protein [Anaplasma phagocytophilum str. CR1007]KJV59509.1 glutamate/Leucine/Phenylalanine/Valine dehydrogenase family protein [Anaplasma phagocytophilum str. Webster]KJV82333.1 glutamate/Leucine/Phenylalanine/Valine dehydrogenase family protein [Anaplasma phagocytophilum str. HGE2]KJV84737.1 glutamate/Leucine/Phenylalanine/Valine dehydrogenase family protein [Anaplasm
MHTTGDSSSSFDGHVVPSVLEALSRKSPQNIKYELLKSFIEKFYNFSYSTDMELSAEFLLHMAEDLYQFINQRKPGESLVRVFDVARPNFPDESLTIVETANDNLPFIVDSVMIAIKKHDLPIYHYTNSVLHIKRDDSGIVDVDILPSDSCAENGTCESVAYFVVGKTTKDLQEKLKADVEKALYSVTCCVNDWKPMLDRVSDLLHDFEKDLSCSEICHFLKWMSSDNFVFLGFEEYVKSPSSSEDLVLLIERSLGLARIESHRESTKGSAYGRVHLYVAQSNLVSNVHRHEYMMCVGIKTFNTSGDVIDVIKESCFYGFFTSAVAFQSVLDIPIIRRKVEYAEARSGFMRYGHNGKALFTIIQKFSREELLRASEEELFQISMGILSLSGNPKVKLFTLRDTVNGFIVCIIFIPKSVASTELADRIALVLEGTLMGEVVGKYYNMYNESDLVRLQFTVKVAADAECLLSERDIEKLVVETTKRWEDRLAEVIMEKMGSKFLEYVTAFPKGYQEYFAPRSACHDILKIHKVLESGIGEVDLYLLDNDSQYQLKIYVPLESDLRLSKVLNVVKKMGAKMSLHYGYDVNVHGQCMRLHHFVLSNTHRSLDHHRVKSQFETVLKQVFCKKTENDYFNSLVILANLQWKEVLLIRALSRYLKQISFNYSQSYIQKVVRKYPDMINLFVKLFEARFDPKLSEGREEKVASVRKSIEDLFAQVSDVVHDYVLKSMYMLIMAILRTSYYQGDKPYLSIKIDSCAVPDMPLPRPFREIYVYSNEFEGIHLRGGRVARGGLRWSDRSEDFRTEILGLMKAQMTKNSVIVPVGSKGGFILKGDSKKVSSVEYAVECYKNFLRGILDITDNIVDGQCVTADGIVRYDDDDSYLVVAADKGTASFSDYANEVSAEYNFWLGDAFASGGSVGFDHKKIGITAKGAWVAAQRHFWVMGRDIQRSTFTVIGIGDMSGDVFGNGMLMSDKICLLGAFNHKHIFVDPTPDPERSFVERKRLFNTPGSSWQDYDAALISKGGGVFCRSSKSISLTKEMRQCFGIEDRESSISPNCLIKHMLKAPVDMIWNGGIGTYVKSSKENNAVVGDKANDSLRIDGKEVRASMIVEGGNLGCTQLGRVEYAEAGGQINTDFVDNSGGVICSDFEVNLKICMEMAVKDNFISLDERNKILDEMLHDVLGIILTRHNTLETRALMLECMQAPKRVEQHHRIMQYLEKIGMLDRAIEFMPSDEEIQKMISESKGFSTPQIAVLIAYTRMFIKGEIIKSGLLLRSGLEHVYESRYLLTYFPESMRDRFAQYIRKHKLKHEILATCISNDIVNRMGCVFASHIESMGISIDMIVRIYVIIARVYNLHDIWSELDRVDGAIGVDDYVRIVRKVQKFVGQATFWLFRHMHKFSDIEKRLDSLSEKTLLLESQLTNVLCDEFLDAYRSAHEDLPKTDINPKVAQRIAGLEFSIFGMDIIDLSENSGVDLATVGRIYFKLRSVLSFSRIRDLATQMDSVSPYWQRIAIRNLLDDLSDYQSIIAKNIIKHMIPKQSDMQESVDTVAQESVAAWCEQHRNQLDGYYRFLEDINSAQLDLSKLVLIIRSLSVFTLGKDCDA